MMEGMVRVKVLIMSDTHGNRQIIEKVKAYYPNAAAFVHCGDSELLFDADELQNFERVKGNCDTDKRFLDEIVFTVGETRFYVTHGHLFNVKSSILPLSYRAQEVGADIVCFGHSHLLGAELVGNTLFVNPGSLTAPRGRKEKSFVLLALVEEGYIVECYDENNNLLERHLFNLSNDL